MAWRSLNGSILVSRYFSHSLLYETHYYFVKFLFDQSNACSSFPLTKFQVFRALFISPLAFGGAHVPHLSGRALPKCKEICAHCNPSVANPQVAPTMTIREGDLTDPSHPTRHQHRPTRHDDRRTACRNQQRARSLGLAS
jgi:hypothetical protein